MAESKCSRCQQLLSPDDTVTLDGKRVLHADCQRPRVLSQEERALSFTYCSKHVVVECPRCAQDFRQNELASDLVSGRSYLCPRCRVDLTERLRNHLYSCAALPGEVRWRAREARAAAQQLVKENDQLRDRTDALMHDVEAALAALREAMRRERG
jgi:transposase-like protein